MASEVPASEPRVPPHLPAEPAGGPVPPVLPVLPAAGPGPVAAPGADLLAGRLHPLTFAVLALQAIRGYAIPALIVLFTGQTRSLGMLLLGLMGLQVGSGLIRYFTFRYRVAGGELTTSEGLLERRERNIPLNRVQDLRLEQGLFHRLLGVVDVNVETAGGSGAEAKLSVLSRAEAEALRRAVFGATAGTAQSTPDGSGPSSELLQALTWRDLVIEGLTANRSTSLMVVIFAAWQFLDDLLPASVVAGMARFLSDNAERWVMPGGHTNWVTVVVAGAVVLVASLLISLGSGILLYHGFRLERRGEDLSRSHGLLTRRVASVPRRRIQLLRIEESWLRRWLGCAAVRADTAGSRVGDEDARQKTGHDVLLPLVRRTQLEPLLRILLPAVEALPDQWARVQRCAIRRGALPGTVVCGIGAVAGFLWNREVWNLWPILLIPVLWLFSARLYHHRGYALLDRCFATRRGWIDRQTHLVPLANIQAVVIHQNPLDRRHRVRRVTVDTAGQNLSGGGPHLSNVEGETAIALGRELAHRASRMRYRV